MIETPVSPADSNSFTRTSRIVSASESAVQTLPYPPHPARVIHHPALPNPDSRAHTNRSQTLDPASPPSPTFPLSEPASSSSVTSTSKEPSSSLAKSYESRPISTSISNAIHLHLLALPHHTNPADRSTFPPSAIPTLPLPPGILKPPQPSQQTPPRTNPHLTTHAHHSKPPQLNSTQPFSLTHPPLRACLFPLPGPRANRT